MSNLTEPLGLGRVPNAGDPAGDYNLVAARVNDLMAKRHQPLGMTNAYGNIQIPDGVGVVSLRFDDGPLNDHSITLPELVARDLVAGFALIGKHVNPNSPLYTNNPAGFLHPTQALEMQHAGMELMNHSEDHTSTGPAAGTEYDQIMGCADRLRGLHFNINSFVRPGPWDGILDNEARWNSPLGHAVRTSHVAAESYTSNGFSGVTIKPVPVASPFGPQPVGLNGAATDRDNLVIPNVQKAIASNGAVTFLIHTGGYGALGTTQWTSTLSVLDYLVQQRDAGNIVVLTPTAQHLAQRGSRRNICPDPSFETYAANAAHSPWSSSTAVVVPGRLSGSALEVGSGSVNLNIGHSDSLRTIEITGWARATSANASARIVTVQKLGTTTYGTKTKTVAVVSTGWTFFRTYMGMDPRAAWPGAGQTTPQVQVQLAQSSAAVQYDDISIFKA